MTIHAGDALRQQIASEVRDYADSVYDLIDSPNGARLAFKEIDRIIREGR